MFDKNITVFNYDSINEKYYPKFIIHNEFQPMYKTSPNVYETTNENSSLLIVPYTIDNNGIYITGNKTQYYYNSPKEWIENDNKNSYITFQNNIDFIMTGDYTNIEDIDFNVLKNTNDNIFVINQINNYTEPFISHFELIIN